MKIFYAVQATGNGHIARAIELIPHLQQYGKVDVFLSGSNSDLAIDFPVKYRSKGLSLFYHKKGGLDYWRMLRELSVVNAYKYAKQLPVERYNLIINDFESITSLACRLKKVPSIGFGHQASFQSSKVPRPLKKEIAGELVLKKFAVASNYLGLHFKQYEDYIFNPVIKAAILNAQPANLGHITVYLSHYADEVIAPHLLQLKDLKFEVFSKKVKQVSRDRNITYFPVDNDAFNKSLLGCLGIITGAGFETPAEALYLGKRLLCIPIKGQYEQSCNAEAIKQFNVPVLTSVEKDFGAHISGWLNGMAQESLKIKHTTACIIETLVSKAPFNKGKTISAAVAG